MADLMVPPLSSDSIYERIRDDITPLRQKTLNNEVLEATMWEATVSGHQIWN